MSTLHLHSATHVALLRRESLVGLGIHQLIKLLGTLLVDLDLDDPAAAIAIVLGDLVDGGGLLLQQHIALDDLALDGGVDVAGRLDGLDGANGVTGLDKVARGLWELDVDNVAELVGGVLGDANGGGFAVGGEVDPFVVLGVLLGEGCACDIVSKKRIL